MIKAKKGTKLKLGEKILGSFMVLKVDDDISKIENIGVKEKQKIFVADDGFMIHKKSENSYAPSFFVTDEEDFEEVSLEEYQAMQENIEDEVVENVD